MLCTRMTTLAFLLLDLSPLLAFKFDFVSAVQLQYSSKYFDNTWKKCRTGGDYVWPTRMTDNSGGVVGGGGVHLFFVFFFVFFFLLLLFFLINLF